MFHLFIQMLLLRSLQPILYYYVYFHIIFIIEYQSLFVENKILCFYNCNKQYFLLRTHIRLRRNVLCYNEVMAFSPTHVWIKSSSCSWAGKWYASYPNCMGSRVSKICLRLV